MQYYMNYFKKIIIILALIYSTQIYCGKIFLKNGNVLSGKIISINPKKIHLRVANSKVIKIYRKTVLKWQYSDGTFGSDEKKEKVLKKAKRNPNYLFEGFFHLSSPLNLLPQFGVGIELNHNWLFNIGAKGGVAGLFFPIWNYFQLDIYFNVKVLTFFEFNLYIGGNLLWRNHFFSLPTGSEKDPDHEEFFTGPSTSFLKQMNYTAHIRLQSGSVFGEIGWEFVISKSLNVSGPMLSGPVATDENLKIVEDGNNGVYDSLNTLSNFSKFYFSVGKSIIFL